jgi:hypothetical protein
MADDAPVAPKEGRRALAAGIKGWTGKTRSPAYGPATPSSPRGQPALERLEVDVGQFRVECLGSNVQVIGRIDAEPVDVLGQVRRQLGEEFGGDLPALGDERADQLGHVQGGVEDDAIGQPGVVSSVPGVAIRWLRRQHEPANQTNEDQTQGRDRRG